MEHYSRNQTVFIKMNNAMKSANGMLLAAAIGGFGVYNSIYTVKAGHRAVIFDRLKGVLPVTKSEGMHFLIPWIQRPVIIDIRTRPKQLSSPTGTRDLQTVNIHYVFSTDQTEIKFRLFTRNMEKILTPVFCLRLSTKPLKASLRNLMQLK